MKSPAAPDTPTPPAAAPRVTHVAEHPYAPFLARVKKPSQYLGGEHGEIRKDWSAVRGKMCLAFPDLYEVGMGHLGYRILYGILNGHPELLAERAYAPWPDMEAELRAHGEKLRSLETARPLVDFDVVGFSLQFELTYTNVLQMLELGGIPLRTADRSETDPLIVAGGPVATHAEPLAPFVDCFLIGDGEERTPELLLAWTSLREAGVSRQDRLRALARLEGIYVPSLYAVAQDPDTGFWCVEKPSDPALPFPVRRAFLPDINQYPFPATGPVPATETVFNRTSIEIARGCTEGCRFCQAGMIYRPVREREPTTVVETLARAVREGGYEEASLTSLSTADYSAIAPLVTQITQALKDEKVSLSVSSLRAYGLAESTLDELKESRAGGLTFAPEAGTQRMRDVVNKNVTEEQLLETARRVFSRGWDKMKLYFMIGLPTEEDEDVLGIVETGKRAQDVGRKELGRARAEVVVSTSTHVPKPHTPFQWCAMDDHDTVVRKQGLLKDAARRARIKLRLHDSEGSWVEGVLARGDRTLADVVETAYQNGARFDSWSDHFKPEVWDAAIRTHGIDPQRFLGTIPVTARLPWDHLDVGLEPDFLVKEYRKALKNRLSPPCGKAVGMFVHHTNVADAEADKKKLVCYHCGVACDLTQMREERLVFLRKLDKRREDKPAPEAPAEPAARRKDAPKQARFTQGEPVRVRLAFSRTGRIAWGSHLDLIGIVERIFRRAQWPLFFSEGFNPKPVMTFPPALPVGTPGLREFVDVKLDGDLAFDLAAGISRLNEVTVEGITFHGGAVLGANDRALSRVLTEVDYLAAVPWAVLRGLGIDSEAALGVRMETAQAGTLTARRVVEGISRTIPVSEFLASVTAPASLAPVRELGLAGDLAGIAFTLRLKGSGAARPGEVLSALFGADVDAKFVRTGVFATEDGVRVDPLDIERLRRAPAPREPSNTADGASAPEPQAAVP